MNHNHDFNIKIDGKSMLENSLILYGDIFCDKKYLFRLSEIVVSCDECLREYKSFIQKVAVETIMQLKKGAEALDKKRKAERLVGFDRLRELIDKHYLNLGYERLIR